MKKRAGLFIVAILALLVIGTGFWMSNQYSEEGYVHLANDNEVWVFMLTPEEIEGETQNEINDMMEERASNSQGVFVDVPFFNRVTGTDFETGEKVRVYYDSAGIQTGPGRIDSTNLILKIDG
ncbi:DUF3221 domain-containing protein [Planococcus salinus]|uniref:DUF3221 domain-containing protein n=1 Tax=Planococcus salinus TaxID=1848460 RepID=A0A3M8PBY2_9BACL|nr:DUF3221 domain-containing protein [Planococcus salinus]RNF41225.1 DUF3221 domain-containing protein [Planococcus salinus]